MITIRFSRLTVSALATAGQPAQARSPRAVEANVTVSR